MDKGKIKIAFIGLFEEDNLGDPIIATCTERLYTEGIPQDKLEIVHVPLTPYMTNPLSSRMKWWIRISKRLHIKSSKIVSKIISQDHIQFMEKNLRRVDAAILVGGGLLRYKGNTFIDGINGVVQAGKKYGFPVIFNAVGVEGYDEASENCRKLKNILHEPSIKYISTRDDYATLFNHYYDGKADILCEKVADPAVWASEVYGVTANKESQVIGIGVIRKDIFRDYGYNVSEEKLHQLYVNLVDLFSNKGFEVHLFTNGSKTDNVFASEIAEELKAKESKNIPVDIPLTAEDLVKIIANYKGIIAGRLHSCIISYSLNIPAVGLVWNEKLTLFGKNIGEEKNYITSDNLNAEKIVETLKSSMDIGYNQSLRTQFRDSVKNSIKSNQKKYIYNG